MTTVSFEFLDVLGQLRRCLKMGRYLLGIKMNFEPRLQVLTGLVILTTSTLIIFTWDFSPNDPIQHTKLAISVVLLFVQSEQQL